MLKERDSENATLRSNSLELEMKFGLAESEVEQLRDKFQLQEANCGGGWIVEWLCWKERRRTLGCSYLDYSLKSYNVF